MTLLRTDSTDGTLVSWLRRLPDTFEREGVAIHSGRNVIKVMPAPGGRTLAVKRYRRPNPFNSILYACIRPGKAVRAYRYGQFLLSRGIATPEPVACIEERRFARMGYSYLVTGYVPSHDCLGANCDDGLLRRVSDMIVRMNREGFFHGDLNLSNFIIGDEDGVMRVVDTNRSRIVSPSRRHRRLALLGLSRLSHVPRVYEYVTRLYAGSVGWDADRSVRTVRRHVASLERRESTRRALKRLLHV